MTFCTPADSADSPVMAAFLWGAEQCAGPSEIEDERGGGDGGER